jgi:uncharacterized membrane protein
MYSGENYLIMLYLLVIRMIDLLKINVFSIIYNSEGGLYLMGVYLLDLLPILIVIMGILLVIQFLYFFVIKKRLRKNSEEEASDEKDVED